MIVIRTAEDLARALDSPLDLELHTVLQGHAERLAEWQDYPLEDLALFVVAQPGDTVEELELSAEGPLVTDAEFAFGPEFICRHGNWIEAVFVFSDDGYGLVLLVPIAKDTDPDLLAACNKHLHLDG